MSVLSKEYALMVYRSWGRAVSGPVLAIVGLLLLIAQLWIKDSSTAAAVLKAGGWLTIGIAGLLVLVAGYDAWAVERQGRIKAEDELTRRSAPKAIIQNLTGRVWPSDRVGFTGKEYYFDVYNSSQTESLEGVRVEVVAIVPDEIGFCPVPLHIKHDDYETREFSVNPGAVRQIDLITGPTNQDNPQRLLVIPHTVNAERRPMRSGAYLITVMVSAKNSAPSQKAVFNAWVNEEGELKCFPISGVSFTQGRGVDNLL